jgi:hypothetical protein
MDKETLAAEFVKIYFQSHPDRIPEDQDKAFEVIHNLHKKFKAKVIGDIKNKSEKFVDKYFEDKDDRFYK